MLGHQYRWLAHGYDLEIGHFLEVASMEVTRWIVAFLHSVIYVFGLLVGLCCLMTPGLSMDIQCHV